jgi:hypothetical protein
LIECSSGDKQAKLPIDFQAKWRWGFIYLLFNAVIPLTVGGGWRGPADVIAVGFYLLGIIPLFGMALMGLGVIGKKANESVRLKMHASLVALFLVVAHVAMIFGMLNPNLLMG